ncbi:MAG TPA: glycosyltransferase [Thermodesulfobacteriota bacterium]
MLVAHNSYQQAGGEDAAFAADGAILRQHGHEVIEYREDNREVDRIGRATLAARTIWSRASVRRLGEVLRRARPDVAHFHNTFLLISPSAYYACRDAGVPVVQTLHNYRLLCPGSNFYRDGHVCEACLGRRAPYLGAVHGCYRGSRAQSGVVAAMLAVHRWLGTWQDRVDRYIVLTQFARRKFIAGGLPPHKIAIRPNFVHPDPGPGEHRGGYALYVGRLSPDKGIATLLEAWRRLADPPPLKVVGSGPLDPLMADLPRGVEWLGYQPKPRVLALMQEAAFLVFPSELYEGFPMTIAEAFATGLPVLASGHGAMHEIVADGRTGRHVAPGDAEHLASVVAWAARHPAALREMGKRARAEFEARYTSERSYEALVRIYDEAIAARR